MGSLTTEKRSVTQSNSVIESAYTMTLNEKRLILIGIAKIDPMKFPKKQEPLEFSITGTEWREHFPDSGNAERDMQRAAKQLRTRSVTFHPRTGIIQEVNWVDSIKYFKGEARVQIRFGWTMSTHLAGMLEQFTKFDLLNVRKLNSTHSIRLYELLSQFRSTGFRQTALDDFRFSMGIEDAYPAYKSLRQWVIEPAIKELNQKTDFDVRWEPIKQGKTVTALRFAFSEKRQVDWIDRE